MNHEKSAGESRRSRRLALKSGIAFTVVALLLVGVLRESAHGDGEHGAWNVDGQNYTRSDAEIATHLLQSVNGANEVLCAAVERAFQTGSWGASSLMVNEPADANSAETARWIGRRRIDAAALDVAKQSMASADACTRKVAARIAGSANVPRLHEALSSELSSSNSTLRLSAITALGHAEQDASVPLLLSLLRDGSREVRITSIWALGAIESDAALDEIVPLLQRDPDPDVRRVAAWALGQIAER